MLASLYIAMGVHTNPKGSSHVLSSPGPGGHLDDVKTAPSSARRRDADGWGDATASASASLPSVLDSDLVDLLAGLVWLDAGEGDDDENPNQLLMMIVNTLSRV